MKIYNKIDVNKMEALVRFDPCAQWKKRMDFLLAATLPTELSIQTTSSFPNYT